MNKCSECKNGTLCKGNSRKGSHANCFQPKPMTNYERIKSMTIDEMAKFLRRVHSAYSDCMIELEKCKHLDIDDDCVICFKEWLETEVKE